MFSPMHPYLCAVLFSLFSAGLSQNYSFFVNVMTPYFTASSAWKGQLLIFLMHLLKKNFKKRHENVINLPFLFQTSMNVQTPPVTTRESVLIKSLPMNVTVP